MNRKQTVAMPSPVKGFFMTLVAGDWLRWIVVLLAIIALFATPLQMMRLAGVFEEQTRQLVSLVFVAVIAGLLFKLRSLLDSAIERLHLAISRIKVWHILVVGLCLRLIWIFLFPAQPGSDGAVYLDLAQKIIDGQDYEIAGTKAYWPVGYPVYLAIWLFLVDDVRHAYLASNLFAYGIGAYGIAALARFIANDDAARVASMLFALWPNLVFGIGTPEKELLVLSLLPWATLMLLSAVNNRRYALAFFAGTLLGVATLVQPSLQFLSIVGVILLLGSAGSMKRGAIGSILLLLGFAVLVAPWAYRNYGVFDEFVLVATNGGSVLYRANNSLATGGYTDRGEIDISHLSEVDQDREGRRLALEWIKDNPVKFGNLIIEKQVRFMGDDAVGVYNTFKVGRVETGATVYALMKTVSNAWWMLIWAFLLLLAMKARRDEARTNLFFYAPIWLWLYLFAIHSVFESAGKYHVPVVWVPCVVFAVMLCSYGSSHLTGQNR